MNPSPISIFLFGAFEVSVRGEPMRRLRSRSVEGLLALLLLRRGRAVSRAVLAATLWPESRQERALLNLRAGLMDLRRAFGPEAGRFGSPTRDSLCLDLTDATVDLLRFDEAIATGEESSLQEAVSLYRGPLLEACNEEWIFAEREARQEACLHALERLADLALARAEAPAALGYLHRAEALDPLRDSVQQRRMQALAASGDLPAALLSYREYRLRLHQEMNLEPDPETTRIFRELQSGSRAARAGRSPSGGSGLWALGSGPGTRAAQRTEAPSGSSPVLVRSPEPRAQSPEPPEGLRPIARPPRPLTALIGREEDVDEVTRLVTSSRLVTLVGGGGVGKTRLSLQVAAELEARFPSRVAFVELASLTNPALLPAFVAAALGMHEEAKPDSQLPMQTLTDWLAQQPTLLVLDNCEHLTEAAAALAQALLHACPELRLLATSRQRLGLTGEVAWRVPSLSVPDPGGLPLDAVGAVEHVLQFPAVQLLVERAQMARRDFHLRGADEAMEAARICQRLDGIPMAIELAAARVTVLSLGQIAARLEDRLQLLTGGSRGAVPRHQTLRALIDWSYDSLRPEEAALLRRLSVFAGGWTLEAAEAVCGGLLIADCRLMIEGTPGPSPISNQQSAISNPEDVLDLLAALEDRSLILVEGAAEGLRYRMLETVREYGWEKLRECSEEEATRTAHAAYFLTVVEAAEAGIRAPEQVAWLNLLDAENGNLRAALAWCLTAPGDGDVGRRLAAALAPFWELRGDLSEGREALSAVLALPGALLDRTRARVLMGAGRLARVQFQCPAARTYWSEALTIWRQLGDQRGIAEALEGLADVAQWEYDIAAAERLWQESLTIWRALGDRDGVARSLRLRAQIAAEQGIFPTARAAFEEALGLHRELGRRRAQSADLLELGKVLFAQGDCLAMRAALEECLAIQREAADRWGISEALFYLGRAAHALGDYGTARRHWEETLALDREKMGRGGSVLLYLARLTAAEGDRAAARAQLEQFIRQEYQVGSKSGVPSGLAAIAELDLQEGDEAMAARRYEEALAFDQRVGNQEAALDCLFAVWAIARQRGDESGARACRDQLLAAHGALSRRFLLVWSLNYLGVMARQEGDYPAARAFHEQSLTIGRELAYYKGIAACLESVAGLAVAQQQPQRAARLCGVAESLRATVGHLRRFAEQADLDATIAAARTALGPEVFPAAAGAPPRSGGPGHGAPRGAWSALEDGVALALAQCA